MDLKNDFVLFGFSKKHHSVLQHNNMRFVFDHIPDHDHDCDYHEILVEKWYTPDDMNYITKSGEIYMCLICGKFKIEHTEETEDGAYWQSYRNIDTEFFPTLDGLLKYIDELDILRSIPPNDFEIISEVELIDAINVALRKKKRTQVSACVVHHWRKFVTNKVIRECIETKSHPDTDGGLPKDVVDKIIKFVHS